MGVLWEGGVDSICDFTAFDGGAFFHGGNATKDKSQLNYILAMHARGCLSFSSLEMATSACEILRGLEIF
jgi:hypothetical protein